MSTLTVALPRLELVHPSYTADQPEIQTLLSVLYEPLLRWRNGRVAPAAVAGWSTPDGGHTWDLVLRDSLRFSDGSPCTAEDVRAAIGALRDAGGPFGMGGVYAPYLREFDVAVTAPSRLTITAERPTGDYFDLLTAIYLSKPATAGGAPLGTTDFQVVEYAPRQRLIVRRVRPGADGEVATVMFLEVEAAADRLAMLEAGQCDVATGLEELPKPRLASTGVSVQEVPNTLSVTMMLNGFQGPFADPRARIALNHALDVDELINEVWPDRAIPARTVVSPFHYGFSPRLERLEFNPDKALRLFEECEMSQRLLFRAPLVIPDRAPAIGRNIVDQLARLGLEAELELEADRPKYARDVSLKRIGDGAVFDSSPLSTFRILAEKVRSDRPGLWWQGVSDGDTDRLIAAAGTTYREAKRLAAYEACLQRLAQVPPWLYLFHPVKVMGLRRDHELGASLDHAGILVLDA